MAERSQKRPVFNISKIYLKDCSMEVPNAPSIFLVPTPPEVNIQIDIQCSKLEDSSHESSLRVTLVAKSGNQTYFLIETQYAGVFHIENIEGDELQYVLNVTCPAILFNYNRELISDLLNRSTFPPIYLDPINFDAMYRQKIQESSEGQDSSEPTKH